MDLAERLTDKELVEIEKRLAEVYKQASDELQQTANEYFSKFAARYEKEHEAFLQGKYTEQEFKAWYYAQVGRGERWQTLKTDAANRMVQTNMAAAAYVNDKTPGIYTLNANFTAYQIEGSSGVAFNLVNEDVVRELALDKNHSEFRVLHVNRKRDYEWNQGRIQNELLSGILQGKSIEKLADGFMNVMGNNRKAAVRNARTAVTSAQNAGRQNTFNKAESMGIELEKEWIATQDNRTRDSHRMLDGVIVKNNEEFPNKLMYPGDPDGEPEEVYNCRCSMRAIMPKYPTTKRTDNTAESYKKWVEEKNNPIYYNEGAIQNHSNRKGSVTLKTSYTYNGTTYIIDGVNVKHEATKREEEVAKMLSKKLGVDVEMVPRICGIYSGVHTPDYLINGIAWDLKEITKTGKDTVRDAVKKKRDQAERFIIDISKDGIDSEAIISQAQNLFKWFNTQFIKEIYIVKNDEILHHYIKK